MGALVPLSFGQTMAAMVPPLPLLGEVATLTGGGRAVPRAGRRLSAPAVKPDTVSTAAEVPETGSGDGVKAFWTSLSGSSVASYVSRCYMENQLVFVVPKFSFLA